MHIAVDARELVGRPTGVGRYLSRLLEQWARSSQARLHRFTLFAHHPLATATTSLDLTHVLLPGAGGTRWEQGTLAAALRRANPDVLFAPAYTAPVVCPAPIVLAIHDVSFVVHPEWFSWREGLRRRIITRLAARRAHIVVTFSDFSRSEIVRRLGIAHSRVRVIPHGLGLGDVHEPPLGGPSRRPLVLFVGSIFNRRHVDVLIRAMPAVLRQVPDAHLAVVGDNRTWPRLDPAALAEELGIGSRVSVAAFVDDERLRALYAEAAVFVFLSEYEGFGLTPLEALAAGVPPVVLDTPVAREVYGDAAAYVAAPDPGLVAEAVAMLLSEDGERRRVLGGGPAVLARYRWEDAAAATLAAIEEAAR
jgi:glycosyltransferase involved in cell wall biosynthesis